MVIDFSVTLIKVSVMAREYRLLEEVTKLEKGLAELKQHVAAIKSTLPSGLMMMPEWLDKIKSHLENLEKLIPDYEDTLRFKKEECQIFLDREKEASKSGLLKRKEPYYSELTDTSKIEYDQYVDDFKKINEKLVKAVAKTSSNIANEIVKDIKITVRGGNSGPEKELKSGEYQLSFTEYPSAEWHLRYKDANGVETNIPCPAKVLSQLPSDPKLVTNEHLSVVKMAIVESQSYSSFSRAFISAVQGLIDWVAQGIGIGMGSSWQETKSQVEAENKAAVKQPLLSKVSSMFGLFKEAPAVEEKPTSGTTHAPTKGGGRE